MDHLMNMHCSCQCKRLVRCRTTKGFEAEACSDPMRALQHARTCARSGFGGQRRFSTAQQTVKGSVN